MQKNTGGSAFPLVTETNPDILAQAKGSGFNVEKFQVQSGMTLRDYFAASALQGLLACPDSRGNFIEFAYDAYRYADALIKARE
jgi:hypothetical protein